MRPAAAGTQRGFTTPTYRHHCRSANKLGDEGAEALALALGRCSTCARRRLTAPRMSWASPVRRHGPHFRVVAVRRCGAWSRVGGWRGRRFDTHRPAMALCPRAVREGETPPNVRHGMPHAARRRRMQRERCMRRLTSLLLNSNKIKVRGAEALAAALLGNDSLTQLELGANRVRIRSVPLRSRRSTSWCRCGRERRGQMWPQLAVGRAVARGRIGNGGGDRVVHR